MAFTHIDCFAGPGGICTGFKAAGIKTLVAIELIKNCIDTYKANHKDVYAICDDIRNVTEEQMLKHIPDDGVDVLTAGFPCETFSTAGNSSRSFYDERCTLFREGIRIAKIANAKILLFENVPAITSKRVSKDKNSELIIDILKRELIEAGYSNYIDTVLNAVDFGVPQRRKRYFILASKYDWSLAEPITGKLKASVVKDAFAGLPNVRPNTNAVAKKYLKTSSYYADLLRDNKFWNIKGDEVCNTISYQKSMNHRAYTLERFGLLQPGDSLKDLFDRYQGEEREELQARKVLPKKMFIKRNQRLIKNEPSATVTSHCLDEFVHPTHDRALTVRECARLQSFPDAYDFAGGPFIAPHILKCTQDKYEQIGDSVPPLLAYAWGVTISKILEEYL